MRELGGDETAADNASRRGSSSSRMIVSEVWKPVSASPGMNGTTGRLPAASTNRSAVSTSVSPPSLAVTVSCSSAVNRPVPWYRVTFALFAW